MRERRSHPLAKVPDVARADGQERRKVRVERHVDRARVLLVQRRDDRLRHCHGRQARDEELVPPRLREAHAREERGLDVAREHERRPDARRVVLVVELVAQGLVQRDERGLGGVVVRYKEWSESVIRLAVSTSAYTCEPFQPSLQRKTW